MVIRNRKRWAAPRLSIETATQKISALRRGFLRNLLTEELVACLRVTRRTRHPLPWHASRLVYLFSLNARQIHGQVENKSARGGWIVMLPIAYPPDRHFPAAMARGLEPAIDRFDHAQERE